MKEGMGEGCESEMSGRPNQGEAGYKVSGRLWLRTQNLFCVIQENTESFEQMSGMI